MTTRLLQVMMAPEAAQAAGAALRSDWIGCGPRAADFEVALQHRLGLPSQPLATCSGTAALEIALEIYARPGSIVVTTPVTFAATSTAIVRSGARIAWADVDPRTGLICPESVRQLVNECGDEVSAVMAVDWCGQAVDVELLQNAAPGRAIIEDAAQAFGARRASLASAMVSLPDALCYSFQATKHVTTVDGGALWVQSWDMPRARSLAYFGLDTGAGIPPERRRVLLEPGGKRHLDDVRAAIGLANLQWQPRWQRRREDIATAYDDSLRGRRYHPQPSQLWVYAARVKDVPAARAAFAAADVEVSQIHTRNDYHAGLVRFAVNQTRARPGVDEYYQHFLAVSCGPWLSDREVSRIATILAEVSE